MCCTLRSVKANQNHIFQKLHTKKDLRNSAFADTLSINLFEWVQKLTLSCVEIILSAHTSFKNIILIVFFHFFHYSVLTLSCEGKSHMKSKFKLNNIIQQKTENTFVLFISDKSLVNMSKIATFLGRF